MRGSDRETGRQQDEAGALQVLDALLVLAETYPDPAVYLAVWDRLLADEIAHADMADDTLAREEAAEDRVVIGTIHAAKGREYAAVAIPDYDCDVTRWERGARSRRSGGSCTSASRGRATPRC